MNKRIMKKKYVLFYKTNNSKWMLKETHFNDEKPEFTEDGWMHTYKEKYRHLIKTKTEINKLVLECISERDVLGSSEIINKSDFCVSLKYSEEEKNIDIRKLFDRGESDCQVKE